MADPKYAIRAVVINEDAWTAIQAPYACSYWSVRPTGNVRIRSDLAVAETEDTLAANMQEACASAWAGPTSSRYLRNETVLYAIAAEGAGEVTLLCRFVK
jgi:hypothetical protein